MSFLDDNKKCKKAFWYALIFAIILLGGSIVGFFYCNKMGKAMESLEQKMMSQLEQNNKLSEENRNLKKSSSDEESEEVKSLKEKNETCENQKTLFENQVSKKNSALDKIKAYNAFFKHMNHVIEVHNGFTGWTEDEHQTGLDLARATGDQSFVETVDWAWNEKSVDPLTRVLAVWKAIAEGIDNAILGS